MTCPACKNGFPIEDERAKCCGYERLKGNKGMLKRNAEDLRLGDRVRLFEGAYGWGTVVRVTDKEVHIDRPYGQTSDVAYGDSVIFYTGIERLSFLKGMRYTFEVEEGSSHIR